MRGEFISGKRVLDYVIYVAIAIALVVGIIWGVNRNYFKNGDEFGRYLGLVVSAAIVFGYAILAHKASWKYPGFWIAIAGLLVIHAVLFLVLIRTVPTFPAIWWGVVIALEPIPLRLTLEKCGYENDPKEQS